MVWFVAEVAVDEVDEVVGEVQEALQDVAHTLGAAQQSISPVFASLTDNLHLSEVVKENHAKKCLRWKIWK